MGIGQNQMRILGALPGKPPPRLNVLVNKSTRQQVYGESAPAIQP